MHKQLLWPIKTAHFVIKLGSQDDLQAVLNLLSDGELVRLSGLQLPDDQMMRSWAVNNWLRQQQLLLITDQTGQLLGLISLFQIYANDGDYQTRTIELGYLLRRDCWGRGIMGEALGHFLQALAKNGDIKRLQAYVAIDNLRSRSLLQKFRFRQVGNENGYLKMVKAL
ncbi:GNAT family N-acetyltransferase [Limosilactobacillus mucosae]|uniref:GNAT family N-acetyltransferase n=1 Tax=Limosilactobacillus mucosae TaxID=97478 RepID=UPI0039950111